MSSAAVAAIQPTDVVKAEDSISLDWSMLSLNGNVSAEDNDGDFAAKSVDVDDLEATLSAQADPVEDVGSLQDRQECCSFIRVHDMDVPEQLQLGGRNVSSMSLHQAMQSQAGRRVPEKNATASMFYIDMNLKLVLDQLVQIALKEATDDSTRYTPGRETANALRTRSIQVDPNWPVRPWHAANPRNLKEVRAVRLWILERRSMQ